MTFMHAIETRTAEFAKGTLDLTLAVCAYNAARRLPAVLEAFAR